MKHILAAVLLLLTPAAFAGEGQDFAARLTPDKSGIVFTSTRDGEALQVYSLPIDVLVDAGALSTDDLTR